MHEGAARPLRIWALDGHFHSNRHPPKRRGAIAGIFNEPFDILDPRPEPGKMVKLSTYI